MKLCNATPIAQNFIVICVPRGIRRQQWNGEKKEDGLHCVQHTAAGEDKKASISLRCVAIDRMFVYMFSM
jgi:hypothetical protein